MKRFFSIICGALAFVACTDKYQLPEGIPSEDLKKGVAAFVADAQNVPLKSVIILQHGKKVAEEYMNGWDPAQPHEMWSASKTYTAFAVGFAVDEGLLSLDDKLTDIFPEECAAVLDTLSNEEYAASLRACTIRDLMVMGCCHNEDRIWPVSMNLSAVVAKVTGELINDYLYPRLWKKLGVEKPEWDMLSEYNAGGWGLHLTTEVMARTGQMMLDGGCYAGKQVLPKGYIEEASKPFFNWDIPSWSNPWEGRHYANGYGYRMWTNTDAFFASGHGGQFIYVFPAYDAVVAVTADFQEGDGYTDSGLYVWKHLVSPLQYDCYEKVEMQGVKGTLRGYIDRPSSDKNQPVVIICHGLTGSKDELHISKLADELRVRGIASVRFDFNGHGQSDGLFREHTVVNEVEETKLIYEYIKSLPWVDASRIGLAGHSQGGFIAGVAAGDLGADKIRACSLLSPAAHIHTTTKEGRCFGEDWHYGSVEALPDSVKVWGRYFGKDYFRAALETDVYARTGAYEGPMYIIQGTADDMILFNGALRYKDHVKDCEIELIENYPHGYDPNVRLAVSKVAAWFEEKL